MTETEIKEIVQKQRSYFYTGVTLPVEKRLDALKKLKTCIQKYEPLINEALKRDLGKSNFESYMCEVGLVLSELSYMIRHTPSYAKEKTVLTPLAQFASRSYKKPSPYGVVLVMSPWNYPFLLTIDPLIDAIAAGNTVVLKPSAYSPHTSRVIETIITECFDPQYVAVVNGGRAENNTLLNEHFDYIFFTGSQHVGREVMAKASVHLTPVTLELGGKSPCIVEKSANLKLAARRIVFGKYLNCGQTCVAPDYIYCDREIKDELIRQIQKQIRKQFGSTPLNNKNYGKIINEKHFTRICNLIDPSKVVCGGDNNPGALQIAPTVMDNVTRKSSVLCFLCWPMIPWMRPSKRSTPWHILWHYISSPPTKKLRKKLLPTVDSEADVSMTPSSTWQPVRWDLAALVKAEWVLTMAKTVFIPSPTIRVL